MKLSAKVDIIDLTKQAFSKEFLKISQKLDEVSKVLWLILKAGGSVPIDIISVRFPNFPKDLSVLEETGILEVRNEQMVLFSEKFEERLVSTDIKKISIQDIKSILLDYYGDKLSKRFGMESLENSLAILLSSVILSTKPNKPALVSKVLRTCDKFFGETGKVSEKVKNDGMKDISFYYTNFMLQNSKEM